LLEKGFYSIAQHLLGDLALPFVLQEPQNVLLRAALVKFDRLQRTKLLGTQEKLNLYEQYSNCHLDTQEIYVSVARLRCSPFD
jgi:hypothetical protein